MPCIFSKKLDVLKEMMAKSDVLATWLLRMIINEQFFSHLLATVMWFYISGVMYFILLYISSCSVSIEKWNVYDFYSTLYNSGCALFKTKMLFSIFNDMVMYLIIESACYLTNEKDKYLGSNK